MKQMSLIKTLGDGEQSAIHMVNHQEQRTAHVIKDVCDSSMSCFNCWHLVLESFLLLEALWYAGFLSCGVFWPWNWKKFFIFEGM